MIRRDIKFILSVSLGIILCGLIGTYTYFKTRDFARGPVISVTSPQNGSVLTQSVIQVYGTVKNANAVRFNDRKIFLDEQGNFNEKLLVSEGYNIITIKAEDRFDRSAKEILEVVYKPNE